MTREDLHQERSKHSSQDPDLLRGLHPIPGHVVRSSDLLHQGPDYVARHPVPGRAVQSNDLLHQDLDCEALHLDVDHHQNDPEYFPQPSHDLVHLAHEGDALHLQEDQDEDLDPDQGQEVLSEDLWVDEEGHDPGIRGGYQEVDLEAVDLEADRDMVAIEGK